MKTVEIRGAMSGYLYYSKTIPNNAKVRRLGTQSNPDTWLAHMHYTCVSCWPKGYQSYDIIWFRHTDYPGIPQESPTGFTQFTVIYYKSNRGRFTKEQGNIYALKLPWLLHGSLTIR